MDGNTASHYGNEEQVEEERELLQHSVSVLEREQESLRERVEGYKFRTRYHAGWREGGNRRYNSPLLRGKENGRLHLRTIKFEENGETYRQRRDLLTMHPWSGQA